MSVDRLFHWTCDKCAKVEIRNNYGFPSGWIFVKGATTTHRCDKPECQADVIPRLVGLPQVYAKQ